MNTSLSFPVVIIKGNMPFHFLGHPEELGLVSKGGESFYNDVTLIDSNGKKYKSGTISTKRKAPFLISLKYFQPMLWLDLGWEHIADLSVDELKAMAVENITTNKKHWEKKVLYPAFIKQINDNESYANVILQFR